MSIHYIPIGAYKHIEVYNHIKIKNIDKSAP